MRITYEVTGATYGDIVVAAVKVAEQFIGVKAPLEDHPRFGGIKIEAEPRTATMVDGAPAIWRADVTLLWLDGGAKEERARPLKPPPRRAGSIRELG